VAADELTKALLLEEVAAPRAIAEALFASVNGGVPLLQALVDTGAASPDVLSRYLGRTEAPFLRQVIPVPELVDRLPLGLCKRLLAIPVRRDALTGTVDVAVADPADPHPANEIAFHLRAPVRVVRAPVTAIEEALRRLTISAREHTGSVPPPADRFREAARAAARTEERERPFAGRSNSMPAAAGASHRRPGTLPPPVPELSQAVPTARDHAPRRGGLVLDTDSSPPPPLPQPPRVRTPPWGTPIHAIGERQHQRQRQSPDLGTEPPRSGYGSEIPIPLTRQTMHPSMMSGGTHRPSAPLDPTARRPREGYALDTTRPRHVLGRTGSPRIASPTSYGGASASLPPGGRPFGSFTPGPPPLPGGSGFAAYAPQVPFPEMGGILAALRNAGARDEILELVLTGARMVALKVALFVVKKGGYLGWQSTPEFADRSALQSVLIPLEANSIFDRAIREDLYLGPTRYDEIHAPLLRVMRNPSRDVAAVPIRVSGKTAVVIVADELGDTMIGTRRLEELARAAGEAFARIVRTRR